MLGFIKNNDFSKVHSNSLYCHSVKNVTIRRHVVYFHREVTVLSTVFSP